MTIKPHLPTYKSGNKIVVKFIEELIIMNHENPIELIKYLQSKKYELPKWLAMELSKQAYCYFQIKPRMILYMEN